MSPEVAYSLAADGLLMVHLGFVLFVVLGQVLIVAGGVRKWEWVRFRWFRWAHLLAIGIVVAQAWLGILCPLTRWENALRARSGGETYTGSFIAHWMHELLYMDAPVWSFTLAYTLFGASVIAAWILVRPGKEDLPAEDKWSR